MFPMSSGNYTGHYFDTRIAIPFARLYGIDTCSYRKKIFLIRGHFLGKNGLDVMSRVVIVIKKV